MRARAVAAQQAPREASAARPEPMETLFRRYAPYVATIGLRLLGRQDEVDDVVQDVFLAATRGLDRLRNPQAARPWLASVAVRVARRRLRARRVRAWLRLDSYDYEDVAAPGATADQRVLLASVYRALDRAPTSHRVAWCLRYVEGDSLEEVAAACGCSLATAKRRIAAARATIDKVLTHE